MFIINNKRIGSLFNETSLSRTAKKIYYRIFSVAYRIFNLGRCCGKKKRKKPGLQSTKGWIRRSETSVTVRSKGDEAFWAATKAGLCSPASSGAKKSTVPPPPTLFPAIVWLKRCPASSSRTMDSIQSTFANLFTLPLSSPPPPLLCWNTRFATL